MLVADGATNGMCALLWFVAFVFISDQWRKTDTVGMVVPASVNNCANAGVAFSFLCSVLWVSFVLNCSAESGSV